jgi:hypothetical protein
MNAGRNIIEFFRDIVQDLLVPELKAVKVSVDGMRENLNYMRADIGSLRADIRLSQESLRQEMKLRDEHLERMITYGDQRNSSSSSRSPRSSIRPSNSASTSPRSKHDCRGSSIHVSSGVVLKSMSELLSRGFLTEERPLTSTEVELICWLLVRSEAKHHQQADQIPFLSVASRCSCGCPTIDLP